MEQMVNKIHDLQFDVFFINGDIFHHKFMSNSDTIMYASLFIDEVVRLCMSKNATLVLLHGTASHDADQLKLFYHYIGSGVDIRIVETTRFEIIKGIRVLCIPEEYNKGYDYYLPIFTIGKYFEQGEKILLPLAIQVHHGVCDGFHLSRFINDLEEWLDKTDEI